MKNRKIKARIIRIIPTNLASLAARIKIIPKIRRTIGLNEEKKL